MVSSSTSEGKQACLHAVLTILLLCLTPAAPSATPGVETPRQQSMPRLRGAGNLLSDLVRKSAKPHGPSAVARNGTHVAVEFVMHFEESGGILSALNSKFVPYVTGSHLELGSWAMDKALPLIQATTKAEWTVKVWFPIEKTESEFKYILVPKKTTQKGLPPSKSDITWEEGSNRQLKISDDGEITIGSQDGEKLLPSRLRHKLNAAAGCVDVPFEVFYTPTQPTEQVAVVGCCQELGRWNVKNAVPLVPSSAEGSEDQSWHGVVTMQLPLDISFKYVVLDPESNISTVWENSPNRNLKIDNKGSVLKEELFCFFVSDDAPKAPPKVYSKDSSPAQSLGNFVKILRTNSVDKLHQLRGTLARTSMNGYQPMNGNVPHCLVDQHPEPEYVSWHEEKHFD